MPWTIDLCSQFLSGYLPLRFTGKSSWKSLSIPQRILGHSVSSTISSLDSLNSLADTWQWNRGKSTIQGLSIPQRILDGCEWDAQLLAVNLSIPQRILDGWWKCLTRRLYGLSIPQRILADIHGGDSMSDATSQFLSGYLRRLIQMLYKIWGYLCLSAPGIEGFHTREKRGSADIIHQFHRA